MRKIAVILGTRPEIIKLSPILRSLRERSESVEHFVIHTNQHYSDNMDRVFFTDLGLAEPRFNLGIHGGSHGAMTGKMMEAIEKVLLEERPHVAIVQGDTNTVLAGSLAACKIGVKVAHVEAGLRSYDRDMPEEHNRVVADHVSDWCFAPTRRQANILRSEGIGAERVMVTGNTVVDAVYQALALARPRAEGFLAQRGLAREGYFLATAHRPSNVDGADTLSGLLEGLSALSKASGKRCLFLAHPRTRSNLAKFGFLERALATLELAEPTGYLENLALIEGASFVATDSGGIQEEACILNRKTLVLRDNTERPETLETGGAMLVGNVPAKMLEGYRRLASAPATWPNPFGDGTAAERIVEAVTA